MRRKRIQAQQELRLADRLIFASSPIEVMGIGMMGFFIRRFEFQRALVLALCPGPLPLGIEQLIRERYVGFRKLWVDAERPQSGLLRKRQRFVRSEISVGLLGIGIRQAGIS